MYFNCFETQVRPGPGGGGGGGGRFNLSPLIVVSSWADPEGETGKSQVIGVTIGYKQLDTTPSSGRSWTPSENVGPPLEPWKRIVDIPDGPEPPPPPTHHPPPPPEENFRTPEWPFDNQLTFIAAVKKGVIPAAHV